MVKISFSSCYARRRTGEFLCRPEYRTALHKHRFINRSWKALEECRDFCYDSRSQVEHASFTDDKDPSGARINHGDRVIADALCSKMVGPLDVRTEEQMIEQAPPFMSLAWRRQEAEQKKSDHWLAEA